MPAGNRIPLFGPKMGCRFPLDPLRETASHFKAQNGMSFPMVIQDQKHVR